MQYSPDMATLDGVRAAGRDAAAKAGRNPRLRQHEWEMGQDQADVDESIALMRAEVKRCAALESWMLAQGVQECDAVPAELTWDGWHRGGK